MRPKGGLKKAIRPLMIRKTINGPTLSITMTRRVKVSLGVAAGAIGEDTDTPAEDEPTQVDLR